MPEIESELRVLLDKQALYELVMRYARGVDRNDKEMLLACFHPDAFLHYNTYQGPAVDFYEQIWAATERGEGGIPRGQHVVTNALFEVRGDVALRRELPRGHPRRGRDDPGGRGVAADRARVPDRADRPLHRPLRAARRRVAHREPPGGDGVGVRGDGGVAARAGRVQAGELRADALRRQRSVVRAELGLQTCPLASKWKHVPRRLNGDDERVTTRDIETPPTALRACTFTPRTRRRGAARARPRRRRRGRRADLVAAAEAALAMDFTVALVEQPYRVAGRRSPPPAPASTPRGRRSSPTSRGASSPACRSSPAAARRGRGWPAARPAATGAAGCSASRSRFSRRPRGRRPAAEPALRARRRRRRGDGDPGHVGRLRHTPRRATPDGVRRARRPQPATRPWRRRAAPRGMAATARALPHRLDGDERERTGRRAAARRDARPARERPPPGRRLVPLGPVPERAPVGHRSRGLQRRTARPGSTCRTTTPARAPTGGARTASPASPTSSSASASASRSGTGATRS